MSVGLYQTADTGRSAHGRGALTVGVASVPERLLIVGNYLPDGQESMARFVSMLQTSLGAEGVAVSIIRPPVFFGRIGSISPFVRKWLGYVDKFLLFPPLLWWASRGFNLAHIADHSNAMYGFWLRGIPWLVTCHDLLAVRSALGDFPQNPTGLTGRVLQTWIRFSLKRSPLVVCVSEATAIDLLRVVGVAQARIRVVHSTLNFPYGVKVAVGSHEILENCFQRTGLRVPSHYLFHVGGNQWYKNRGGLLQMMGLLRECRAANGVKLVVAGEPLSEAQQNLVSELGIVDQIAHVGPVSNAELECLYQGARALVFPSFAEGFGWPVLEAQACGCPVITSDRPPMSDIGGPYCISVDPADAGSIAAGVRQLLAEAPEIRSRRIEEGRKNAARFSENQMIGGYFSAYKETMQSCQPC